MNRIVKIASAAALTLGLAVFGLPLVASAGTDAGTTVSGIGSTGCCKV